MRAVLYARVSGDDRKYATSGIESQLADCRRHADGKGYTIVGEYYETPDKQTSGADWGAEIMRVVELAEAGAFDVLVVREVDRLARDQLKYVLLKNDLELSGVRIEYVIGNFDASPEGQLVEGFFAQVAAYEKAKIRQRTMRGRARSVSSGNVTIGGSYAPFGYDLVTNKQNGRRELVVNEAEAAIVRLIFELYGLELYTLHTLANYLDEHGIAKPAKGNNHKAKTEHDRWSVGTLHSILGNETYVGRWYYRKTRRVKGKNGKYKNVARPREEWLLVEVPALITEELFQLVQWRRLANKREKGGNRHYTYPLSGILTCGHCGNGVSGMTRYHEGADGTTVPYRYYKCNARHLPKRYGFKCELPQIRIERVDGAVWKWVLDTLLTPGKLRKAWHDYQEQQQEELRPLLGMLESNETRLVSLEEEKGRLIKAYTAGALTLDEIADEKSRIDKQIADVTAAIAELRADLAPQVPSPELLDTLERYAERIGKGADLAAKRPEEQQEFYRLLQMSVKLTYEEVDGRWGHWAEIRCILGTRRLSTESITTCYNEQSCIIRARMALDGSSEQLATALFITAATAEKVAQMSG